MEKYTILCICLNATGHINGTLGVANALKNRGHKVVFAGARNRQGIFSKLGFHEEIYDEVSQEESSTEQLNDVLGKYSSANPLECYKLMVNLFDLLLKYAKHSNDQIKQIVEKWKPDAIIEDRMVLTAALITSSIPLIKLCTLNPLYFFDDERLPAAFLGLPLNDKSNWEKLRQVTREMRRDNVRRVNEWLQEIDKNIPKLDLYREYVSTNLNIYRYPKGLVDDYLKQYPEALEDEWIRLDYSPRPSIGGFEIPENLRNKPGKLIFVSMGTIGSSNVALMNKIVAILSKAKHRFIFSKGDCEDSFELAENMWGEGYVPQLDILPLVDLVIFHGGNNTLTEVLYYGKPMIIMPLFADQFDNAQRAVEKGIGLVFNPFMVNEKELLSAIDFAISDNEINNKIRKISNEMQISDSMDKVCEKIEYVAKHPKFPTITGLIDA